MNLKTSLILFIAAMVNGGLACAQLVRVEDFAPRRVDTVILERNWRTRDKIILSELDFTAGDTVSRESLEISLKKIWNLQNFATVGYRWDSLPDGRSALILIARDGLTIVPIFAGNLQKSDFTVKAGLADRNFLGRNIRLEIRGQYGESEPAFAEIKLAIPRQLLWKNLTIGTGIRREDVLGVLSDQAFITFGNPFNQDYHYTFSPDLELGFNRFRNSYPFGLEPADSQRFEHSLWYFRISESIGTVTYRRHQEEGYKITGMIGAGFGLDAETENHTEASLSAEYHKLLSPKLQFSIRWQGSYSSSTYKYLWVRYGQANIRGIEYGDLTGPLMQLASTGLYYTWLNWDYLAIEQSAFVQYASVMTGPDDRPGIRQHYAIGTGFQFTIPMYPAASLLITFSFNPNRNNWFYLEL